MPLAPSPAATSQAALVEYGTNVSLQQAKQIMQAAEACAALRQWPVAIAIVDTGGHLVLLQKMDHTQIGSIAIAQQKAETAVRFKRPSKVFEDALADGGIRLRVLAMPGVLPLEGGVPLVRSGKIVGAIGVSGVQSQQDAEVAEAGAAALSTDV